MLDKALGKLRRLQIRPVLLPDGDAADLAVHRLRKRVDIFDDARVLVGRRTVLRPRLELACQLIRARKAVGKHDRRLNGKAANGVRHAGDSAFTHRLVFEQLAFDLKGPDTVAG